MTRKRRDSTPAQRAALQRGQAIRTLCMVYTVAAHPPFIHSETVGIQKIVDEALLRVRGESETAKRKREHEAYEELFKADQKITS